MPEPVVPPAGEHFDPKTLDRSVIAIPLLHQIQEERALANSIRRKFPKKAAGYNAAFVLPARKSVTDPAVRAMLKRLIDEALDQRRELSPDQRTRHRLGGRVPDKHAIFAWLDAQTIRRILTRQEARRSRGEALPITIEQILPTRFQVIIDLNLEFIGGRNEARNWVEKAIAEALIMEEVDDPEQGVHKEKSRKTDQYVFATLSADVIFRIVEMDVARAIAAEAPPGELLPQTSSEVKGAVLKKLSKKEVPEGGESSGPTPGQLRAIFRIWPDFQIKARITRSISTVKANAAINSFAARGTGITWAVMDTGIQGDHPHFSQRRNIVDPASPMHRNFTFDAGGPLIDENGHGTHVAGIIAGEWIAPPVKKGEKPQRQIAVARFQDEKGDPQQEVQKIAAISGMAPECHLVSLKVLDDNGIGNASNLISAIAHVQEINGYGRRVLIHGVNISIGYDFDPKWFACGQSPLCVEVDRLVKSGVVVVVAAGNTGYGAVNNGSTSAGLTVTINDPGNADLAITVGATHRDMPHVYGVSYFSSKGPTGDGRLKPDLVAPGERIISCASSTLLPDGTRFGSELKREVAEQESCEYIETSGTSMAAPHVSGVIAAFLSVRREFIGRPEQVKQIFVSTATDLRRDRYFQGAGLIDLMRAIQSV